MVEVQSVGRDVTRRKKAETALRESGERLRRLSAELLLAQEKERKRIAGELHDSISQSLTAIKFMAEKSLNMAEPEGVLTGDGRLAHMVERIQQTIDEVRRIMTDLRPSMLDDIGIVATIGWFCREFREVYSGIRVEVRISIDEADIPDPLKIVLFRTLQEAMNNVVKHSKADYVSVSLAKVDDRIETGHSRQRRRLRRQEQILGEEPLPRARVGKHEGAGRAFRRGTFRQEQKRAWDTRTRRVAVCIVPPFRGR